MQKSLSVLLKYLDIRILYGVMALIIPFYMLFAHKGYIAIYHFYRKGFGYAPFKAFISVYKNHYTFGKIILDRFSFYAGNRFDLEMDHYELFENLAAKEEGFMQLSSHVGNYELAGYSLKSEHKTIYALVYAGETETVMKNRTISFDGNNIEMVPVAKDLSHMITMSYALSDGQIVSIAADRVFGSAKSLECDFLGHKAVFPLGPFALACQRNVPIIAAFVVKTSTKGYKVIIREVKCEQSLSRKEKMEALVKDYVHTLEGIAKQYPYQWFNFFEFFPFEEDKNQN